LKFIKQWIVHFELSFNDQLILAMFLGEL